MIGASVRNMAGAAIPAIVNIFTIPYIVRSLGNEGYGAFALIASIVGYFSLLDINVTSGSVKFVAEHNAKGERQELCAVVTLSCLIYFFIGIIGLFGIFFSADFITGHLFTISVQQRALVSSTLQLAAIGFFIAQIQVYLNSIPQSLNRYDISALFEVIFGIGVPLGTVFLLWLGFGLHGVVAFRVAASAVNVLFLVLVIKRLIPDFRWITPSNAVVRKVSSFSGYAYLSSIAAVTYAHADKLIIGSLVGVAEVTYYAVPATLVNRLLGLTYRLGSVLFPVASELDARGEHERLGRLYLSATRYLTYINTFVVLIISLFSFQILRAWLGEQAAVHGQWIMVTIALSMLMDSLTNLPSFLNDGLGFPKITGSLAAARAVTGLVLGYVLTRELGIFGAALAHLISSLLLVSIFLVLVHRTTVPVSLGKIIVGGYLPSAVIAMVCGALGWALGASRDLSWMQAIGVSVLVSLLYILLGAVIVLEPVHRQSIKKLVFGRVSETMDQGQSS